MRFCIFGTPRSGSQYVSETIKFNSEGMTNIAEPFTPGRNLRLNNGLIKASNEKTTLNEDDHIDYIINMMKQSDVSQSIVMKLFPSYDIPKMQKIVSFLKSKNFQFVRLKRTDIEKQLLSFILAVNTQVWLVTDKNFKPEKVHVKNLVDAEYLRDLIKDFDKITRQLGIDDTPLITYETAIDDLKLLLQKDLHLFDGYVKYGLDNPYYRIINADEVKNYIQNIMDAPI